MEEDVFFGDVTNKEAKKVKKFGSRKTAVYVPGFRMDRRLMRYTMGPQAIKTNHENPCGEETIEEETTAADPDESDGNADVNKKLETRSQEIQPAILTGGFDDDIIDNISQKIESVSITDKKDDSNLEPESKVEAGSDNFSMGTKNEISGTKAKDNCNQEEKIISQFQNLNMNGARDKENNFADENSDVSNNHCKVASNTNGCEAENTLHNGLPTGDDVSSSNADDHDAYVTKSNDKNAKEKEPVRNPSQDSERELETDKNTQISVKGEGDSVEENVTGKSEPIVMFGSINKDDELELDPWGNKPVPVDPAWYKDDCSDSDSEDYHEIVIRARLRSPIMAALDSDEDTDSDSDDSEESDEDSGSDDSESDAKDDDGLEPDLRSLITEVINESIIEMVEEPNCPLLLSDEEHQGVIIEELTQDEEDVNPPADISENDEDVPNTGHIESEKKTENRNNSNSNDSELEKSKVEEKSEKVDEDSPDPLPKEAEVVGSISDDDTPGYKVPEGEVQEIDTPPESNGIIADTSLAAVKSEGIDILPIMTDDNAMAIDTIVARAADNEEIDSALALPELNVDDVIDLLQGSVFPDGMNSHDDGNGAIFTESGPMQRRNMGDNTVVVASTNRLRMPLDTQAMYRTLPEIQTKIDSTHTVTSVTGPISSPGAPRCARKYRSIYATLPADDSIEIETHVPHERDSEDILSSFQKLDLGTAGETVHDGLDDPMPSGNSVSSPLESSSPTKRSLFTVPPQTSPIQNNPFSVVKNIHRTQHSSLTSTNSSVPRLGSFGAVISPEVSMSQEPTTELLIKQAPSPDSSDASPKPALMNVNIYDCNKVQGRANSIEAPRALNLMSQSVEGSPVTGTLTFSPSLVFKESNFSPILEVKFPHSPPISIPSVQPPAEHYRHFNRDKKRKQPYGEVSKREETPLDIVKKNTHGFKNKTGTAKKPGVTRTLPKGVPRTPPRGVPRTPPKKVIGQPNIHKFNTPLSSSRSLFHKHCAHTSPRPKAKASVHHINHRVPKSEPRLKTKPPSAKKTPTHHRTVPAVGPKTPSTTPRLATAITTGSLHSSGGIKHGNKTPHSHSVPMKHKHASKPSQTPRSSSKTSGAPKNERSRKPASRTPKDVTPSDTVKVKPSPRYTLTPVRIETISQQKTPTGDKPRAVLGRRTPGSQPQDLQEFVQCEALSKLSPNAGGGGDDDGHHTPQFIIDESNVSSSRRKRALADRNNDLSLLPTTLFSEMGPAGDGPFGGSPGYIPGIGELPVYKDGTPRFPPNYNELFQDEPDGIYSEPPPPFHLYDLDDLGNGSSPDDHDGSRESSPRLSMEDVLERKRQQMMNLRAEKRKIQDIISKQGTPSVKTLRPNNTVSLIAQPKPRFSNTQTLSLSDKELDAVTHLHTLCNSQRAAKVIHKGRAMVIRQHPQSPRIPGRLSWNDEHLIVDVEEESTGNPSGAAVPKSPNVSISPKPILAKKDPGFVYPFHDEPVTPVVVIRSRNSDRHKSTRSPRID